MGERQEPNFDDVFKPARRKRKAAAREGIMTRISARNAGDLFAVAVAGIAVLWVFVNALGFQKASNTARVVPIQKPAVPAAPVAAPLPQPRPEPAASGRSRTELLRDVQQELAGRGYYDGAVDGLAGPRISQAIRDFEQTQRLKTTGEASEALLAQIRKAGGKSDITGSIKPAGAVAGNTQTLSVQKLLARYGYGPVHVNGVADKETREAIIRFERDRKMPETGEVSDRLRRELASFSGAALD